ncbi:MAG: type 1 glutamine amidotransferase domain-containing protein [Hyphomicrobium sp.]|jgi:protease I
MPKIKNAKILILATDGVEQSEIQLPLTRLREAGALVHVAAPKSRRSKETIRAWHEKDWGEEIPVDAELSEVSESFYDALVLPGGQINPDLLRVEPEAMQLIRTFLNSGKPLAAICHAPWLLVEAKAVRGRKMTSYKSIKADLVNAGANWLDQPAVADEGIVTSRDLGDLDAFIAKIIEEVEEGKHQRASIAA